MESTILTAANHLLDRTRQANNYQREIELATGENFNLFRILNIGHYEVRTHSPLLGDLLYPEGNHGQGPKFLEHFLAVLKQRCGDKIPDVFFTKFNSKNAKVKLEEGIGERTETSGGRLDIVISSGNVKIAIENKIYAAEQEFQIQRYLNKLSNEDILIYLTLDGSAPTSFDEKQRDKVICLSYKDDIIDWLKLCRKEAATTPIVRENLTQYIHLIQYLTQQNTSSRMDQEIVNSVLSGEENLRAFFALCKAEQKIRATIVCGLLARIKGSIPSGFTILSWPKGEGIAHENFRFSTPALKAINLCASIEFESADFTNCFIGFYQIEPVSTESMNSPALLSLKDAFSKHPEFRGGTESNTVWPAWQWWKTRQHWDVETFKDIQFKPAEFDREFLAKINALFEVAVSFAERVKAT
jgi:hypothetical protein